MVLVGLVILVGCGTREKVDVATRTADEAPSETPIPTKSPSKSVTNTPLFSETSTPTWTPIPTKTLSVSETSSFKTSTTHLYNWCPIPRSPAKSKKIRVVYIDLDEFDHNVWLWDEGEEPIRLTDFNDVVDVEISDDGEIIAFLREISTNQYELWSMLADGSEVKRVITDEELFQEEPIPDDYIIRFYGYKLRKNAHMFFIYIRIFTGEDDPFTWEDRMIDVQTGEIYPARGRQSKESPDGNYVATYHENGINLYTSDGMLLHEDVLPEYRVITENERYIFIDPIWSENSDYILIVQPETDDIYKEGAIFSVQKVWVDGRENESLGTFEGFALSVHISPDHKFMYYRTSWGSNTEMHLVNMETKEVVLYLEDHVQMGEWSPNSQDFFYFITYDIFIGNVCQAAWKAEKLDFYLGNYRYVEWLDGTTYMTIDKAEAWELKFFQLADPSFLGQLISIEEYDVVMISSP
jgi:hypothetical protein